MTTWRARAGGCVCVFGRVGRRLRVCVGGGGCGCVWGGKVVGVEI